MLKRRVAITGLGMVTPLGNNVVDTWKNIVSGRSGIGLISHFDVSEFPVKIAGLVKDLDVKNYLHPKELKKMSYFIQYGLVAGIQAFEDSDIDLEKEDPKRIGVVIGSGIGGIERVEEATEVVLTKGGKYAPVFCIPSSIINMASGNLSIKYGLKGPNLSVVSACSSGTHSIGEASRMIEYGDAEVMLAGGAEKASSPVVIGGFAAMRALSKRNDAPEAASRPWDQGRDGFVLSDGAGVVVLEEYTHAKQRGANIYAELIGYGMSGDASHITAPVENGQGALDCMENALDNAEINPSDVDYINAHGTSTRIGDIAETTAVKRCFGQSAKNLPVSSTKSMTGHLLGAAGSIEAIFTVLSLHHQVAPPTINLDTPDPSCDLDYVPKSARDIRINIALTNSFGFGGSNGTLIFKRAV